MLGWNDFFERWFDESSELDLPEIINQIIKYSTNDSFLHPQFFCSNFIFSYESYFMQKLTLYPDRPSFGTIMVELPWYFY